MSLFVFPISDRQLEGTRLTIGRFAGRRTVPNVLKFKGGGQAKAKRGQSKSPSEHPKIELAMYFELISVTNIKTNVNTKSIKPKK